MAGTGGGGDFLFSVGTVFVGGAMYCLLFHHDDAGLDALTGVASAPQSKYRYTLRKNKDRFEYKCEDRTVLTLPDNRAVACAMSAIGGAGSNGGGGRREGRRQRGTV